MSHICSSNGWILLRHRAVEQGQDEPLSHLFQNPATAQTIKKLKQYVALD
jgi:hypothetical protein